jgi:hypothetical protein
MGILDGLLGHGTQVDADKLARRLDGVLIEGENVNLAYKVIRDFFVSPTSASSSWTYKALPVARSTTRAFHIKPLCVSRLRRLERST